jgi:hypothetical protein
MKPFRAGITAERLRELLDYDPETGVFRWRARRGGRAYANAVAGTIACRHGYRQILVDLKLFLAHRLAWLYVYGEWPPGCLDHINRQRDDNRIANLRLATMAQNCANARVRCNNTSGFPGVRKHKQKWTAYIKYNGRQIHLGMFDAPEKAHKAYRAAAVAYFGEFARGE